MSRITDCPKYSGKKRIPIKGLAGFDEYFLIEEVFSQQPATFAMEKER